MRALSFVTDLLRLHAGRVVQPRFVTWAVTLRCNATCGACDSWRLPPRQELTPQQAGALFADLGPLDAVRLTGGEPTLRADLPALADAVRRASNPAVLHLTTHGGFPDRVLAFAEGYAEPKRLRILVSLDGLEAEHDRSRGHAVSFERAMTTIRGLVGLRRRGLQISVNHTVVSPRSLADGDGLRALLAPLSVDVQPVIAYESSATYGLGWQGKRAEPLVVEGGFPLHPALDRADVMAFIERALADLRTISDLPTRHAKRYYLRGLLARLRGDRGARPRPRCVALRAHLRVLPDGAVPVCQFNGEVVGRLPAEKLATVWNGEAATRARKWVDACPGCWAECEVLPNALYSGDILRP